MARQFCYQDKNGFLYPEHSALHFEPGLVPGWYDTEKKVFTPNGNPKEKTGNIITDVGYGQGETKLLSGLKEDKGAMTAPVNGIAFSKPDEPEITEDVEGEDDASSNTEDAPKRKKARKVAVE